MRYAKLVLILSAVVGFVVWERAEHARTRRQLAALAAPPEPPAPAPPAGVIPRELHQVTLPPYVIEVPDVLTVEATLRDPATGAALALPAQPVTGQFLVRLDGTVGLGVWGPVSLAGLTPEKAREEIRRRLAGFDSLKPAADRLSVSVDVAGYNSKVYYVITDSAGRGEQVVRFPHTGNETVLDAITQAGGRLDAAGSRNIWVARPFPAGSRILPVDWAGITREGVTTTNYQLLPGDRVFVAGKK